MSLFIEESSPDRDMGKAQTSWTIKASWNDFSINLELPNHKINAELFRWYLEDFVQKDPLSIKRSTEIKSELELYGEMLRNLLPKHPLASDKNPIHLRIIDNGDKSTFHSLPWELLEADHPSHGGRLVVSRGSQDVIISKPTLKQEKQPKTFNILLLAARVINDQAEYSQAALPIVKLLQSLPAGSPKVNLDIVRPGTFEALEKHLQNARVRDHQYHLVHLDLHGNITKKKNVALMFAQDHLVMATTVADLLKSHGVEYVVINACESARGDYGLKANLAKTFIIRGIAHVLAMSYKLQISAVSTLVDAFYRAFLTSGCSFAESAAAARKELRKTPIRKGRFGIDMKLEDWIVPVVYSSSFIDKAIRTSQLISPSPGSFRGSFTRHKQNRPILDELPGRDGDILELESKLHKNEANNLGRLLLLSGKYGSGKTRLLNFVRDWWSITGWLLDPIHIDMERARVKTPEELCERIFKEMGSGGRPPSGVTHMQHLRSLLKSLYDKQGPGQQNKRRPLLILDHLPQLLPLRNLKPGEIAVFKQSAELWRLYFEELSTTEAYTIVSSNEFPWYIDQSQTSEWPWEAYYMLDAPRTTFCSISEAAGTTRGLQGLLKSPKDIESFEMISGWSAICPPLLEAMVVLIKAEGLDNTVKLLRTNADLIARPSLKDAGIHHLRAYAIASEFWKQCTSFEKHLLVGFAPFHECLPRCSESYAREWCLGRLEQRHPFRDWFLKRAPKPSVDNYWATVNHSTTLLTNLNLKVLIFRLKKAGLIQAVALFSPTHMDDDMPALLRSDREGTKMYTIHPLFSIFLRHKSHKAGYGLLGSTDEKSNMMTKIFVQHHDSRTFEWMGSQITGSPTWDMYCESRLARTNFVTVLELELCHPQLSEPPIPIFLAWCLTNCNGWSSQFVLTRFSPDALLNYCVRARPQLFTRLSKAIKLAESSSSARNKFELSITLSAYLNVLLHMMSWYLLKNEEEFNRSLDDTINIILNNKFPMRALCAVSPNGDLQRLLDLLYKYKQIRNNEDSCVELTIIELLPGRVEKNQILTNGWAEISKSVSCLRSATNLYEKYEAFTFWDNVTFDSEVQKLRSEADSIFTAIGTVWKGFIEGMDVEALADFQRIGFKQAEASMKARLEKMRTESPAKYSNIGNDIKLILRNLEDGRGSKSRLRPPNYASIAMDVLEKDGSLEDVPRIFEKKMYEWKSDKARRFLLAGIEVTPNLPDEQTKMQYEGMQVKIYILMNDWQSLEEYLEFVAVHVRSKAPQSLDVPQLRFRIWWHNLKGICALRLREWDDAYHHLKEAFRISHHRHKETSVVAFSALRVMMNLYNSCPKEHVFQQNDFTELDSFWKIVVSACFLGYQGDQKLYARNGTLLSILLQATAKEKQGYHGSIPESVARAVISVTLSRRIFSTREEYLDLVSSTLHNQNDSVPSHFLHVLKNALASATAQSEAARQGMKEAENHLFKHDQNCDCHFLEAMNTGKQLLSYNTLLPFIPSYERLDYRTEIPFLNGISSFVFLWIQNKFRVSEEEFDHEKIVELLKEWHAELADGP